MKLFFGGDVCVSGSFAEAHAAQRELIAPDLQQLMKQADRIILNLEGPLLPPNSPPESHPIHNPLSLLPTAKRWGNLSFTLANNHMLDAGVEAAKYTCEQLDSQQIPWTGIGTQAPIEIEQNGVKVGIAGLSFGKGKESWGVDHPGSDSAMAEKLKALSHQYDHLILCYHGEEEYTLQPWPKRRQQVRKWAKMGVSAVICHHPHVPQGWEEVEGVPIFYSLGNFLFDRPHHHKWEYTDTGLVVMLELKKESLAFETFPLKLDRNMGRVEIDKGIKLPLLDSSTKAWRSACYKAMFEGHVAYDTRTETSLKGGDSAKARKSSVLSRFFRPSFYQTILAYLRHANTRAILIGAILHKLTSR